MSAQTSGKKTEKPEIEAALADILATEQFARSDRLRAFLAYVVEETLAGRASAIRAKTIAQDVYGRTPSDKNYNESIVRVDARRLRRMLDDYYGNEGIDAPLIIGLPTGRYIPEFSRPAVEAAAQALSAAPAKPRQPGRRMLLLPVAAMVAVAALGLLFLGENSESVAPGSGSAERIALFEKSGAVLQAENLCTQGRGMLFPIADREQQQLATDLFRRATTLAPDYPCGFAGAAHSLGTLALLMPTGDPRDAVIAEALEMAERAQSLDPGDGWSVSAVAWTSLITRDLDRAAELSKLSEQLSPTDGNVLDFHGVISVLLGDYHEALRATDPDRERDTFGLCHATRNIHGVARFHRGEFEQAIASWKDAIAEGEPVSSLTLLFLAVSHQALGEVTLAAKYARDLSEGWPTFNAAGALKGLYPDKDVANEIIALLTAAGWQQTGTSEAVQSKG